MQYVLILWLSISMLLNEPDEDERKQELLNEEEEEMSQLDSMMRCMNRNMSCIMVVVSRSSEMTWMTGARWDSARSLILLEIDLILRWVESAWFLCSSCGSCCCVFPDHAGTWMPDRECI